MSINPIAAPLLAFWQGTIHWAQVPAVYSWALVAAGALYTVVAYFQLLAIKRQAAMTERILTRERLPFLFLKRAVRHDARTNGGVTPGIRFTFKNYGLSPGVYKEMGRCIRLDEIRTRP